jgi:hypothetical protein
MLSETLTDMKVTSREFQRNFARMKLKAAGGETLFISSGRHEFAFHVVKPKTWQGALKGKARIMGDLFDIGLDWESGR